MSDHFTSYSLKVMMKKDIEDSLKVKTVYKLFEYLDDYSYGTSKKIGILIENVPDSDKIYLYLFQEDGPKDILTFRKILEWYRSGESEEIGHKGGGNKRNIYGFKSKNVILITKINEGQIIKCETNPDKLYTLASSEPMSEAEFRSKMDTSEYIKIPEVVDIEDLPAWYSKAYEKIKTESGVEPIYLTRFNLTDTPEEFTNKKKYKEMLHQIGAKQYIIDIFVKNELLDETDYIKIENIDLVGLNDDGKINEKNMDIYIEKEKFSEPEFFIKHTKGFKNVKTGKIVDTDSNLLIWGKANMFVVDYNYFKQQLDKYNKEIEEDNRIQEEFYGIYFMINGKLTNFIPVSGTGIVESRNNRVLVNYKSKNVSSSLFRIIIIPNPEICKDNRYFDSLIQTSEIKALSKFLDKSPYTNIIKKAMEFYRQKDCEISPPPPPPPPPPLPLPLPKPPTPKEDGGIYLIYLAHNLYKFGMVEESKNFSKRLKVHEKESIKKVEEYTNKKINHKTCTVLIKSKTFCPKALEEFIERTLMNDESEYIKVIPSKKNNKIMEYFICEDIDYITQTLTPMIEEEITKHK